jgi:hypothetical protein
MHKHLAFACLAVAGALPEVAHAHHGLDFILVETAHLPERGSAYAFARINDLTAAESETELEPAALWGVTNRIALETHAHYAKEGDASWHYESVAGAAHFLLSPPGYALSYGVSVEYALGHHTEDIVAATGAIGYGRNGWMTSGNLLYEKATGASGEWSYAAGIRKALTPKHGVGLETRGTFEEHGYSELVVGYYGEWSQRLSFNAGIGTRVDEGPDHAAHMTFIWRFK